MNGESASLDASSESFSIVRLVRASITFTCRMELIIRYRDTGWSPGPNQYPCRNFIDVRENVESIPGYQKHPMSVFTLRKLRATIKNVMISSPFDRSDAEACRE